jgi:hypothetical protein
MAPDAKSSQVREVTFSASFDHRLNVMGIPETAPSPVKVERRTQSPSLSDWERLKPAEKLERINAANRTKAAISGEHLQPQVAGIASQFPLVNAGVAAECSSSFRNLDAAPATDAAAIWAAFLCAPDPPSFFRPARGHLRFDLSATANPGRAL